MTDTAISWSQIEAECGDYRAGFVATFRKYEGRDTDEIAGNGQIVKVTVASFARHIGVAETTFRRWLGQHSPSDLEKRSAGGAGMARNLTRSLPATEKAKLAAELLDDENVANDPTVLTAQHRASTRRAEKYEQRVTRSRAADPIGRRMDEKVALLDLQGAINTFVRDANRLLPEVGPVDPGEAPWLTGETERLETVTANIRYLADHGETRTDAELRTMTGGA